jgi:hypothetical protein
MVASWAAVKVGGTHDAAEAVDDEDDPDDEVPDDDPDDEDPDEPAVPDPDEPVAEVSFVTVIVY